MPDHRAIFLSDLHLGMRACQAEPLLAFLQAHNAERIYLAGDLLDLWRFRSAGLWFPQLHVNIVRTLLGKAKHGTELVYIPGNHDELLRQFLDLQAEPRLGRIRIASEAEHRLLDGRRLWITHGDQHHGYLRLLDNKPLHWLVDKGYGLLTLASAATRPLFAEGENLSRLLRGRIKRVGHYYERFAEDMARRAAAAGYDGVVCGHNHHPELREVDGTLYLNCGDWVDNCSAAAETPDGRLILLRSEAVESRSLPFLPVAVGSRAADGRAAA
jgi:UDP-2,3-diacylglucosamine pyrophosphatase LpxH